jgi:iron complex outermembrane receptor protein
LNLAAFIDKYKNIQTALLQCPGDPGVPCALPLNVGNADIKGVELELEAHPIAGWSVDGSWSDLTFKYTSFQHRWGFRWVQYEIMLPHNATLTPRVDFAYTGASTPMRYPRPGARCKAITWSMPIWRM